MPGDPSAFAALLAGVIVGFMAGLLIGFQIGIGRRD
jgi:hypothetical protein